MLTLTQRIGCFVWGRMSQGMEIQSQMSTSSSFHCRSTAKGRHAQIPQHSRCQPAFRKHRPPSYRYKLDGLSHKAVRQSEALIPYVYRRSSTVRASATTTSPERAAGQHNFSHNLEASYQNISDLPVAQWLQAAAKMSQALLRRCTKQQQTVTFPLKKSVQP